MWLPVKYNYLLVSREDVMAIRGPSWPATLRSPRGPRARSLGSPLGLLAYPDPQAIEMERLRALSGRVLERSPLTSAGANPEAKVAPSPLLRRIPQTQGGSPSRYLFTLLVTSPHERQIVAATFPTLHLVGECTGGCIGSVAGCTHVNESQRGRLPMAWDCHEELSFGSGTCIEIHKQWRKMGDILCSSQ